MSTTTPRHSTAPYLWEAIQSNAPTTHGISLDAIMEMGEKRAEEAKKRQEAEDKRILGETATVEPEKEPAEDPNRLYPGDKVHASWDQRFKKGHPMDAGEYDGIVRSVTPYALAIQFQGEQRPWTFRVMNGMFFDVQNFCVQVFLLERAPKTSRILSPEARSKGDVFKLILDYLYRKRGKSVLSVVQSEIHINHKQYGANKFKDFLAGVPGVELTQQGSVIFAQLNEDFLRR